MVSHGASPNHHGCFNAKKVIDDSMMTGGYPHDCHDTKPDHLWIFHWNFHQTTIKSPLNHLGRHQITIKSMDPPSLVDDPNDPATTSVPSTRTSVGSHSPPSPNPSAAAAGSSNASGAAELNWTEQKKSRSGWCILLGAWLTYQPVVNILLIYG